MKKTILLSVMGAAILAMGTASAGGGSLFGSSSSSESSALNGLYVGGSYGLATTNCIISDAFEEESDCDTSGWKAFAGYKINDMLAVEGGYYHLGESDETFSGSKYFPAVGNFPGATITSSHATGEASGLGVSGVLNYEVFESLGVFGKLGVMKYTSEGTLENQVQYQNATSVSETRDASVDGVSLLWGVGGSYQLTDNIGVRGEYEGFTREDFKGKEHDVSLLSAGFTFSTY